MRTIGLAILAIFFALPLCAQDAQVVPLTSDDHQQPIYPLKPGWENGIQFDKDFRFVVPKPYQAKAPPMCSPLNFAVGTYNGAVNP